jgi:hypothetical protein
VIEDADPEEVTGPDQPQGDVEIIPGEGSPDGWLWQLCVRNRYVLKAAQSRCRRRASIASGHIMTSAGGRSLPAYRGPLFGQSGTPRRRQLVASHWRLPSACALQNPKGFRDVSSGTLGGDTPRCAGPIGDADHGEQFSASHAA